MRIKFPALALSLCLVSGLFTAGNVSAKPANILTQTTYGFYQDEAIDNVTSLLHAECLNQGGVPGDVYISRMNMFYHMIWVTASMRCS